MNKEMQRILKMIAQENGLPVELNDKNDIAAAKELCKLGFVHIVTEAEQISLLLCSITPKGKAFFKSLLTE